MQTNSINPHATLIRNYTEGFLKHYPNTKLEVFVLRGKDGQPAFKVMIDGSDGGRPLSVRDMQESVQAFAR
jgi:hypothetical protein